MPIFVRNPVWSVFSQMILKTHLMNNHQCTKLCLYAPWKFSRMMLKSQLSRSGQCHQVIFTAKVVNNHSQVTKSHDVCRTRDERKIFMKTATTTICIKIQHPAYFYSSFVFMKTSLFINAWDTRRFYKALKEPEAAYENLVKLLHKLR